MSEEQKEKDSEFVVEPISDDELEDVSGGEAPDGCAGGSGCCDGVVQSTEK